MSFADLKRKSQNNFDFLQKELEKLIDKQKTFYFRIKFSDDPEAKSVLETMKQGIVMLGATPGTTIEQMFDELLERVQQMKDQLRSGTEG